MDVKYVCEYKGVFIWRKADRFVYLINLEYFQGREFKTITDCEEAIDEYMN